MMGRPVVSLEDKIIKYASPEALTGCILWSGPTSNGYPRISLHNKEYRVSRYLYKKTYGIFEEHLNVCHTCDNPLCINPDHLFLGTHTENQQDKFNKNRQAKGVTHGRSKLTNEQATTAKFTSIKPTVLAKEFNCSSTIIRQIRQGKYWKHLEKFNG
jgi:hypothetical protein